MKSFLLFLFLLLIPSQLGKHFWPEWSYVLGIRVDYLSPTLYLLDLIWLVLFFNWIKSSALRASFLTGRFANIFNFKTLIILGFVVINILMSADPWVAVYKWIRIGQAGLTWIYFRKNNKLIKEKLIKVIPCWIFFESLLAIAQMARNESLGGIFYWFGERTFNFNTIGIAQMSVLGEGVIRAYGTFSHPNSLAGFLLVSLLLWWWLKNIKNIFYWVVFWFGVLGIMISGSRTIWCLGLGLFLMMVWKNIKNRWNMVILLLAAVIFILSLVNVNYNVSDFLSGWDRDGIRKRIQLNVAGIKMIENSPWFGIGAGNFLVRLPDFQKNHGVFWLQPVHNVLILLISEVGVLGGLLLFLFLIKNFNWKKIGLVFKIILGVVVISGMVDHYWLTLPQNIWLLVLVLGIA